MSEPLTIDGMLVSHEMDAARPKCKTCVHWCSTERVEGMCCRFPPACLTEDRNKVPVTDAEDWCGEHQDFPAWLAEWRASRVSPVDDKPA